jgi:transcriptional regulator with XRE-family HTH domain
MGILQPIGSRLREERLRMQLTLDDLAEKSGAHKNSLGNYENGKSPINVAMLLILQDIGFDLGYVITGRRSDGDLGFGDSELLRMFGMLSHREREGVVALVSHLSGQTVSLKDIGSVSNVGTLHDRQGEFKPKPEGL